ncbi:hypothetical protein DLM76_09025 [Leptospira yasudae]|nr:hypothetical protein DLM76_09025 [Leptospira yasudae]
MKNPQFDQSFASYLQERRGNESELNNSFRLNRDNTFGLDRFGTTLNLIGIKSLYLNELLNEAFFTNHSLCKGLC